MPTTYSSICTSTRPESRTTLATQTSARFRLLLPPVSLRWEFASASNPPHERIARDGIAPRLVIWRLLLGCPGWRSLTLPSAKRPFADAPVFYFALGTPYR